MAALTRAFALISLLAGSVCSCAELLGIELDVQPYPPDASGGASGSNSSAEAGAGGKIQAGGGGRAGQSGTGTEGSLACASASCGPNTECAARVLDAPRAAGIELLCLPSSCSNREKDENEIVLDCGDSNCGRCDQVPFRTLRATKPLRHPRVIYRRTFARWILSDFGNVESTSFLVGKPGDVPVMGDFDGDGNLDFATWLANHRSWTVVTYVDGQASLLAPKASIVVPPGEYMPLAGHFDNGKADTLVLWNPKSGKWLAWLATGNAVDISATLIGEPGDIPVPGDYDGNGRWEIAVYRAGTWLAKTRIGGPLKLPALGDAASIPVPCHYNEGPSTDLGVYERNGKWTSVDGVTQEQIFSFSLGAQPESVVPIAGDFTGDNVCDPSLWNPETGLWETWDSATKQRIRSETWRGEPSP